MMKMKQNMRYLIIAVLAIVASFSINSYAALSLSVDSHAVFFGSMQLGEEKELLTYGGYHNEVKCSSTNNQVWYLKIHLLKPMSFGEYAIPLGNFQWQAAYTNGIGTLTNENRYTSFGLNPNLVYISGPGEANGAEIKLQFKYKLIIPEFIRAGTYNSIIRYTLTEIL